MKMLSTLILIGAATALAGCKGQTEQPAPAAASSAAATTSATPAAAPAAAGGVDYAAYVGKYPFDAVNGKSIMQQPDVIAAVTAAVGDPALVRTLNAIQGPGGPIASKDGKLNIWQCQEHNCGAVNWTVIFDPASKSAEVCYGDAPNGPGGAMRNRWFSGGKVTARSDECPAE